MKQNTAPICDIRQRLTVTKPTAPDFKMLPSAAADAKKIGITAFIADKTEGGADSFLNRLLVAVGFKRSYHYLTDGTSLKATRISNLTGGFLLAVKTDLHTYLTDTSFNTASPFYEGSVLFDYYRPEGEQLATASGYSWQGVAKTSGHLQSFKHFLWSGGSIIISQVRYSSDAFKKTKEQTLV